MSGARHPSDARATAVLALTLGEPAGIGPDITLDAWRAREADQPFVVYGSAEVLADRARMLGMNVAVQAVASPEAAITVFPRALPVIDMPAGVAVTAGRPNEAAGASVIAAIEQATADVVTGRAAALVTNPIAKSVLYKAGFGYPGHTEFLAALAERHAPGRNWRSVMMLACAELRVVPLTIHVPYADVPSLITRDLIHETVRIVARSLVTDFGIARPRIVVAGLNPHAGEDGSIGSEEVRVIAPALEDLRREGLAITGPLSGDTLFHAAARATYDAAVCMFHDQALIPIKTIAFDAGVNVTLGLPFVRTSPDHGTAFGIAGSGTASASSLKAALAMAREMVTARAGAR